MKGETMKAQTAKPSFYNICITHKFNSQKLQKLASISGVPFATIDAMCNGIAVARSDAEKVLAAFSQFTQGEWALKNVNVLLAFPTFADLYEIHELDTASLSQQAGVPLAIVDQMLCNHPVPKSHAEKVLQTLSRLLGQSYTLETVVVLSRDGEVQRG